MGRIHKNQFWRTLFLSYLSILIFSLLTGVILFTSSLSRIKESVAESSKTALLKVSDSIDRMESELLSVTNGFLARDEYISLLYARQDLSSFKLQRVANLQDELRRQVAYSGSIGAIYIWFEDAQLAATTAGYYKSESSFDSMLQKEFGVGMDEVRDWAKGSRELVVCPVEAGQVLAASAGTMDSAGARSIVLMKLRTDNLQNLLRGNDTDRFWLESTRGGQLLAPRDATELAASVADMELDFSGGEFPSFDFEGERLAVMRAEAGDNFTVYSARNFNVYMETQRQYITICVLFLAGYLVLGVVMALGLSRYNCQPIQRLNQLIVKQADVVGVGGDLAMLEAGLNTLLRYYHDYEHAKFQQEKELRRRGLVSLLLGEQGEGGGIPAALEDSGLNFSAPAFALVGIVIRSFSNLFFDKKFAQDRDAFEVAIVAVNSISGELLEKAGPCCLCQHDGKLWALVTPGPWWKEPGSFFAAVREACVSSEAFARERLGIDTYYYVGQASSKPGRPGKVHKAFQEARWGLEQMESYAMDQAVAGRGEIEKQLRPQVDVPPGDVTEKRKQLFSAVTAGDLGEADRIYLELRQLDIAFSDGSFSTVRAQSLILMGYFLSFLPKSLLGAHQDDIQQFLVRMRMETHDEGLIAGMHDWMEFFYGLWKNVAPQQEDSSDTAAEAARFVLSNYTDTNLSVAYVAERLSVSSSYLSRLFRKKYGMSVLDFIHRQRVDAAKVYIRESKTTVEAVAGLVGYANSLALIRAFKRYEGCTPTEYRQRPCESQDGRQEG